MSEAFETIVCSVNINGHEVAAEVRIVVLEDFDSDINDHWGDSSKRDIKSYFIATIGVEASALGECGSEYTNACIIHCNNMFAPKPFSDDVNSIVADHDMLNAALADLKLKIIQRANDLAPYADKGGAK